MADLLLSCQGLAKAFGAAPLFEGISLSIFEGDHVGVVGPNGSGKTTLLRILAAIETPSAGTREARRRLRLGYVAQDPVFAVDATVDEVLREGLPRDDAEGREVDGRIAVLMGRAGFTDPARRVGTLSGGWKKRLAIARELARAPEILLLDEPTNHLDVEGILWLEEALRREPEAFVVVSHDRYFLESIARRMIEINRAFASGVLDVRGGYRDYLAKKDEVLANQASYQESLRNRVRGELDWLSRKARARTRKAQARVDEAGRLQSELADLDARSRSAVAGIELTGTDRRSKRLLVTEGLSKRFEDRVIVERLDLVLSAGARIGLLGPNGSGKTTVLQLLAGSLPADGGTISRAEGLRVVTFDQHRSGLDLAASLQRNLAPEGDSVAFQGRTIHVSGWAKRFLFRPEQLETPVAELSGGEQARVLIARLMLEPADVLLLDEPTNDLDIPTLEMLEESLLDLAGALVLVTHDRYLLDRVCTEIVALDGRGGVARYAGYAQWESTRELGATAEPARSAPAGRPAVPRPAPAKKKLGYQDQREWEQMEDRILEAEERLAAARSAAEDPAVAADHVALSERLASLAAAQAAVEQLYARWSELEAKITG
ncbi:MAG: ABC-F family ATP-binding cassette domain-containing protein [Acidobacteriota bacterium]